MQIPDFQVLSKHQENFTLWSKLPTSVFASQPPPLSSRRRNTRLHHQGAAVTARGNSKDNRDWVGGNLNQPPAVREKPLLFPDQGPHRQMFSDSFVPFSTCLLRNNHVPACEELSLEEVMGVPGTSEINFETTAEGPGRLCLLYWVQHGGRANRRWRGAQLGQMYRSWKTFRFSAAIRETGPSGCQGNGLNQGGPKCWLKGEEGCKETQQTGLNRVLSRGGGARLSLSSS